MRLHRFYVEDKIPSSSNVEVSDPPLIHQWRNVFRFEPRAKVILCDDSGFDYVSQIDEIEKDSAKLTILESVRNENVPVREVVLFAALTKKDTFEWTVEKGTELGVSKIIPVLADRSEKKDINFERIKKIIKEAAEQSGRATLPRIYEVMTIDDVLAQYQIPLIAFDPLGSHYERADFEKPQIGALIGPEGGWSDREIELFHGKKIIVRSLGKQILRAETASVAIMALMLC